MGQMPPLAAFTNERQFRRALYRLHPVDLPLQVYKIHTCKRIKRCALVAENPGIPIHIGANFSLRLDDIHINQQPHQDGRRMRVAGILRVMGNTIELRFDLGMLQLQPRHDHSPFAGCAHGEGNEPLSRDESKAGEIEDIDAVK